MSDYHLLFRRIGAGFCGTVWTAIADEDPYFGFAFKREDGGPERSLQNDFEMHNTTIAAHRQLIELERTASQVEIIMDYPALQIPSCHRFLLSNSPENETWWVENRCKFPQGYSPCNTIQSERIPAMPERIRNLLIEKFCPTSLIADIKKSDVNQDCLVRPYLGRRRYREGGCPKITRFSAFSLRNFPLHLDQMEGLGIDCKDLGSYARIMAKTLATMHWFGEIDGNDVEFVLAPPRRDSQSCFQNVLGEHVMWLLDFDCCKTMALDEVGIDRAVTAFLRNDPFYPRPNSSPELWAAFRDEYLQVSSKILRHRGLHKMDLAEKFIREIEQQTSQ
jgi:hypothetical protein